MSTGTIIIFIVVVVIVAAAVVAWVMYDARSRRLRQRFGAEYDRLVDELGSRRKAEAELGLRQRRVRDLDIRPLNAAAQARYAQQWAAIQERFVDAPQEAVTQAQRLVMTVMKERGYPTEGDDQVLADLSVEHASVVDHYRAAYGISQRAAGGTASTEDLRQAMIHYRALFQELLGAPPQTRSAAPATAVPAVGLPEDTPGAAANGSMAGSRTVVGPGAADGTGPRISRASAAAGPAADDGPAADTRPAGDSPPRRRRS